MPRPTWLTKLYGDECYSLGGLNVLTNIASTYDGTTAQKGLGLAEVDFTSVASFDFVVFVNKVGTGTQSWQLWNVTDAAQLAVIDDAGASGDKTLTATVSSGLPTGKKVVRVRAKSTVVTDDPVYYGGYLVVR